MIFKNPINKDPEIVADKLLNNELFVHPSWEIIPILNGEIDWTQNPFNSNTWCFYLHSLSPVNYLVASYEKCHKTEYIKKAAAMVTSWLESNDSLKEVQSKFAWKDHSTANRVIALIYFWTNYKKSEIYEEDFECQLFKSLKRHGDFLFDDKNYNFRNNHGAYQDRSLIELATLFPEWENSCMWFDKAKIRLMNYIKKFISPSGIHKEHSAAYHILMIKLLQGIDEFLIYHDKEIPELSQTIYDMEEYLAYIVKPSGVIPMTGDSGPDRITFLKQDKIKNPKLLYVRMNGKKGEKPLNEIVYKEDGIGIFRDSWQNKNPLFLKFTAAFHSLAHKHADDLSFILTIGNTDFFVDSGKYNYKEQDAFRKYFRSSLAHNSITVNRKTYELQSNQSGKSKILCYGIYEDFSYLIAQHELYPGVKIERTLIYFKKSSSVLLHDQIKSSQLRTYSQIYNIGKDVIVEPITKKKIKLTSAIDNKSIELIQVNHVTEFKNFYGETAPIAGWQSSAFNDKYPIHQLQFSNKGKEMEYKTIINLNPNKGIKNFTLKPVNNKNTYKVIFKNNDNYTFDL